MSGLGEVLAAHREEYDGDCGTHYGCSCGWDEGDEWHHPDFAAHVEQAVLAWLGGVLGDAETVEAATNAVRRAAYDVRGEDESRNDARARAVLAVVGERAGIKGDEGESHRCEPPGADLSAEQGASGREGHREAKGPQMGGNGGTA